MKNADKKELTKAVSRGFDDAEIVVTIEYEETPGKRREESDGR